MNYTPTEWKSGDIVTSEKLNHMENGIANAGGTQMLSVTYAELLAMRNAGTLTSGMQYRITDYVCTTTQAESQAVSHPFDIIVVADSASVLNENARAIAKDGDTYYQHADLSAWELKYCIDNDDNRFAWADTVNGKGVIYYMKDDRNNECPYDFKQIQFKRYPITECAKVPSLVGKYAALTRSEDITGIDEQNPVWCYTFSVLDVEAASVIYDGSIAPLSDDESDHGCSALDNKISSSFIYKDLEKGYGQKILFLNNIVFNGYWGNSSQYNTFGDDCYSNTFGNGCTDNTFGNGCSDNTFGDDCGGNTFGNGCYSNTFGDDCYSNTFGDNCYSNTFVDICSSNTFGGYCSSNTFGGYCWYVDLAAGLSISNSKRYYHVLDGVKGAYNSHISITGTSGNNFETYVGMNSSGVLKTWVPADMVQ